MIKKMTCIECPRGCSLSVDIENCKAVKIGGAGCPKGMAYAISEVEDPSRILTATVMTEGLDIKFLPVRTDKPIPKKELFRAVEEVKKIRVKNALRAGDTVDNNFMGLGVRLVATRSVG